MGLYPPAYLQAAPALQTIRHSPEPHHEPRTSRLLLLFRPSDTALSPTMSLYPPAYLQAAPAPLLVVAGDSSRD
ncbi:unnamed protein product [Arctogadus glacialis]